MNNISQNNVDFMTPMFINIRNPQGERFQVTCIYGIVKQLYMVAKEQNAEKVKIPVSYQGFETTVDIPITTIENLLRNTESSFKASELNKNIIPKELGEYLFDDTLIFKKFPLKKVVGRKNEIEKCWFNLSQEFRNNLFLVGEADVGKTTLVNELTRQITRGECPDDFADKRIISVNVEELVNLLEQAKKSVDSYGAFAPKNNQLSKAENVIELIQEFINNNQDNIILYIDEVIYMLYDVTLIKILFNIIRKCRTPLIATILPEDFERFFLNNPRISKYINYIEIKEPPIYKMKEIIDSYKKDFEGYYKGITISDKVIKFAIYTSRLDSVKSCNPGKTINIIRKAFTEAQRQNKTEVDKECVLKCYNTYYESYENMDKRTIKETAYHEAGHYIAIKLLNYTKNVKANCVSILPMMGWMGVNITESDIREYAVHSSDYYKDHIAISLAGRIAEAKVNNNKYTAGASSDLQHARIYAKVIVTMCALNDKGEHRNRVYNYDDYFMIPESKKEFLDNEIQNVIDEGYNRAVDIINNHEDLLKIIAEKLIKEEILTMEELDEICQEYFEAKEINKED